MAKYNTGNPLGSKSPKDLSDNAQNLDDAVNDLGSDTWVDRFGRLRITISGMWRKFVAFMSDSQQRFDSFILSSGYQDIGVYGPGLQVAERNQIFWKDGELYRAGARLSLPYVTSGNWEIEGGDFVAVGDAALRQELANPSDTASGAGLIGFRQRGSGYTRTLSSRGRDSPHVRDYGPVSGDATDTLQKAADAVAALPYSERCLEIDGDLYFDHLVVPDVQAFTITQRSMRSARLICTNLTDAPSITFLGEAPCWQNINLQMPLDFDFTASNKVGVLCKRPVGSTADMDGKFYGGRISRFGRGIENWGRGLSVGGMMILSACNECIYLEWPNVGDYVETDTIISSDSTGFRAFQFIGVRFHSFVSSGITNIGPNAHKINGGIIQGCLADIGRTIFDGYANNFLIDLGNSNLSARTVLNLRGGNHNRIRLGTLRGSDLSVPPRRADILVRIRGNGDGNYIGDGTLGECMNHAIDIRDGAQTNMTIAGIKFKNVCLEDAAYSPINVVGQGHDIKVRDIEMEGSLPVTAVVRCTDAGSSVEVQQDSIRISGYPAMPMIGAGCFSVRRSHVPGGQDRKETVGDGPPEGVVTGLAGDIYRQINATAGQALWIKTSNTGSTGWRCTSTIPANSTGARPVAPVDRYVYWDTTLNKLIVYDAGASAWRDAMGAVV